MTTKKTVTKGESKKAADHHAADHHAEEADALSTKAATGGDVLAGLLAEVAAQTAAHRQAANAMQGGAHAYAVGLQADAYAAVEEMIRRRMS